MTSAPMKIVLALMTVLAVAACGAAVLFRPAPPAYTPTPAGAAVTFGPVLDLPPDSKVLFVGDGWVGAREGYAALAAKQLGWVATIRGVNGSGFVAPGEKGTTYLDTVDGLDPAAKCDLVVLAAARDDGRTVRTDLADRVGLTVVALRGLYPETPILMLGPIPTTATPGETLTRVNTVLATRAEQEGIPYLSPVQEEWITPSNLGTVLDAARHNPTPAGHRHFSTRFADDISRLTRAPS